MSAVAPAEMFARRLDKRWRHLRSWARRNEISCFRVYDHDIPEVPLIVDHYAEVDGDGRDLVVSDRRRFDDELADATWLPTMLASASAALGVAAERVFVKRREKLRARQEGHQYERLGIDGAWRLVAEGGHRFWVNLSDYLDTGLFFDHRPTRARVAAEAGGTGMLNLFAYTGAFTVYAAGGGARSTTTVDLSRTYLDWAGRNWAANGLRDQQHPRAGADVRQFLAEARAGRQRWDLVVADPPTFSNSRRMAYTWDVQRDHAALLADLVAVTAPGGVIWFSINRERFRLDHEALPRGVAAVDLTAATIPEDIRDPHAHRVWRLTVPR